MSGWVRGGATGLLIPAHGEALKQGGADFLTAAFRAAGTLGADNAVTRINQITECKGGSTGRKFFLSVAYTHPAPGLHESLFVKFSRDFEDPIRDRGRDQLGPEIRFAAISRRPGFPINVPACMFGDYHAESQTGLLITETITFGHNGIAPHHEKCLDYELPDALARYHAVITANARLAGAHRAGMLGPDSNTLFPYNPAAASDPIRYDARQLRNRATRIGTFAKEFPKLLPENIANPAFIEQLAEDMPHFLTHEHAIQHFFTGNPSLIALCHWNANLDNAWFWHDESGALRCGLMDWGRVGQMNIAHALWGTLSAAEPDMLDAELDALLTLFLREYTAHGGPAVTLETLQTHMFLYVATMAMAWLLDAPPIIRAQLPGLSPAHDRFHTGFKTSETARTQLHMLTNVLNLWQRRNFGRLLAQFS